MFYLGIDLKVNIEKENRTLREEMYHAQLFPQKLVTGLAKLTVVAYLNVAFLVSAYYPLNLFLPFELINKVQALQPSEKAEVKVVKEEKKASKKEVVKIKKIKKNMLKIHPDAVEKIKYERLLKKYKKLAGPYYYVNVEPYLPMIDRVLKEKRLDNDAYFVQAMFFIGQHESHWQTHSISGSEYGGEHPTGIFQFLPSTFRSVSYGNIYNAEDQVRAYITMVERGRVREFGTLYIPTLSSAVELYVLNFPHTH